MKRSHVYWMKCDCTVWPLTPLFAFGRCGDCGQRPHTHCAAPADGKAHRL